jgi:cell wall-active antibiotic response 4TMS protein YvqF
MSDRVRCTCPRCRLRGLMWPAILITAGVLFLIAEFSNRFGFGDLWPVLLIVIGVIKLIEATASTEGHITSEPRPQQ